MTVASETNRSGPYNGNGVTTVFDYEFRIISQAHLRVIKTVTATGAEATLALEADYTVSGVGASGGGQITALVAPIAGETITILRKVPFVQETDLENQGAYYAETVENVADLAAMRDQELAEGLSRAVQIPASADPSILPALVADITSLAGHVSEIDAVAGIASSVEVVADISDDVALAADNMDAIVGASSNAAAALAAKIAAESAAGANLANADSRAAAILTNIPGSVNYVRTAGIDEPGDRGDGLYIEGDATSPGGFTSGGRGFQIVPSRETINLKRAGAVFDSEAAASANRTILNALSTWCEARKIDIEINKGTCYVTANNGGNTGWNVYPAAGTGFLRVFGHGDDSVIKRAATATLAASSSLTWAYANANGKLTLENFKFDGNEANCPFDAGNLYAHEQSAALRMRAAAIAGTFDSLELYGMRMTGLVADGYQAAVSMNRFVADDFKSSGRTRRVRSDIQFSRIPLVSCVINNFEGDAFEMEPSFTNTTHQMLLSQMLVRGALDLAGDTNFANIIASDIVHLNTEGVGLNFGNLYKVKGKFRNCTLTAIDRMQRCQVEFQGGEIRLRASETYTASAVPLAIWNDSAASSVEFDRTHFCLESGVSVQTGFYVQPSTAHNDLTRSMEFNECTTDGVLDHFLAGDVYGTIAIRGGNPAATRSVISVAGVATTKEHIYLEPTPEWSAAHLLRIPSAVAVTTAGDCVVSVAGEFASAKMLPIEHWAVGSITIASGNVSAGDTVTINGHAITFVASGAVGAQINIGAEYLATTIALVNYINSHRADCGVSASGSSSSGIISLTAVAAGTPGNVTLAKSGANITVSGGALTGGGTATTGTAITWRTTARMIVPSTPAAVIKGFPGLTAKLDMPSYGNLKDWSYEPTLAQVGRYNDSALWREVAPTPAFATFTDLDTTPSVAGGRRFKASNTGATIVTALDGGVEGQEVTIVFTTANTTIDFTGTTLKGNGGVDWVAITNDHMTCVFDGANWFCNVSDNS